MSTRTRNPMPWMVCAIMLAGAACGPDDEQTLAISANTNSITTQAATCTGQSNILVTTAGSPFIGAKEHAADSGDPALTGHAAAVEMIYSDNRSIPRDERFTVAWVGKNDRVVYYRTWNTLTKSFTSTPKQLYPAWPANPNGPWLRRMGYDDNCAYGSPYYGTCAWFTWENVWGYVNYQGISSDDVSFSPAYTFPGHAPSGDSGCVNGQCRKLITYIDSSRRYVLAKILNADGAVLAGPITIRDAVGSGNGWHAYQTTTEWNPASGFWWVTWTEHPYPSIADSRVMSALVYWYGTCSSAYLLKGGGPCISLNSTCAASGHFTGPSAFSTYTDTFRVMGYNYAMRVSAGGQAQAIFSAASNYSPVVGANFYSGNSHLTFQSIHRDGVCLSNSALLRWVVDSANFVDAGSCTNPPGVLVGWSYGQAARADDQLAAFVASNGLADGSDRTLGLSVVDVQPGACPP